MIEKKHVDGQNKGEILLYALSTCSWCKKTKDILNQIGVAYDYIDIDKLTDEESTRIEENEVKKWNPARTYPTIVINNQWSINKFNEDKLRELGK